MYGFSTARPECAEGIKGVLTAALILVCDVQQYAANKLPLIIRVYPTKTVLVNTQVEIWVSPLVNPSQAMVAGAIVTVTKDCKGEQRCPLYEARGYYETAGLSVTNYANTTATFTPSNSEVLMQSVQHSYTFASSTCSGAIIDYP